MSSRQHFTLLFLILLLLTACQSNNNDALPTLAVLPSVTPTSQQLPTTDVKLAPESISSINYTPTPTSEPVQNAVAPETVPNQIVLQFDSDASETDRTEYIQLIDGTVIDSIEAIDTVIVVLPESTESETLPASPAIQTSEPDYYVVALQGNPVDDPLYPQQWALPAVGAPEAWAEMPADAPSVTIAVIDSGVCLNHPELEGRILAGYDYIEDDETPQDEMGHGCGVTGVIAANSNNAIGISGLAPNAKIMPLRVLDEDGLGTYSDVASAIIDATDAGVQIINVSLGGTQPSTLLSNAIDYAVSNGVTVIAAAGNTGTQTLTYPAAYPDVIAVGALASNLEPAAFSVYGDSVDFMMPGQNILTTSMDDAYAYVNGTSFAAAHASALIALEVVTGNYYISTEDALQVAGLGSNSNEGSSGSVAAAATGGNIEVENLQWETLNTLDIEEMAYVNTWMTFHQLGTHGSYISVNDTWTLRIYNTDTTDTLDISSLVLSDTSRFDLPNAETSLSILSSDFYDLDIQFIESSGERGTRIESLTINSSDADDPVTTITLAGYYMVAPEGENEGPLAEIIEAFGYTTDVGFTTMSHPDDGDAIPSAPVGEEVFSATWERLDPSEPVYVRQLAAFHGCCVSETYTGLVATGGGSGTMRHEGSFGQTLLPALQDTTTSPTEMLLTPNGEIQIGVDGRNPCDGACTLIHGLRFYPLRNPDGEVVPGAYLIGMDLVSDPPYSSTNYDYQDNMYIVTNLKPLDPPVDMVLTGSDASDPVAVTDDLDYSFEVTNDSLFTADNVQITIDLENTLSLVSATPDVGSCVGTDPITCNLGSISGGVSISIAIKTDPSSEGNITSSAVVSTSSTDNVTSNDTVSIQTVVLDAIPGTLTIVKEASPEQAVPFNFTGDLGDFQLIDNNTTVPSDYEIRINFQPEGSEIPDGYEPDYGYSYGLRDNGEQYGWFRLSDGQAVDATGTTRNRFTSEPTELDTLNHFQHGDTGSSSYANTLYWEFAIPNGEYEVTIILGDATNETTTQTNHAVAAEDAIVISGFTPDSSNRFVQGTATVTVTDGRLTIVPTDDGVNVKINYIIIRGADVPANQKSFSVIGGTSYSITEEVTTDWTLDSVNCVGASSSSPITNGINVTAIGGAEIICTFNNVVSTTVPPSSNFTYSPTSPIPGVDVQFTDQSTGAIESYVWNFGDGTATSTLSDPTHVYSAPGTYTVTLKVSGPGGSDTIEQDVSVVDYAQVCLEVTIVPQSECQALVDLYTNLDGDNWTDSLTNMWLETYDVCSWTGVTCESDHITGIDRSGISATGILPDLSALTMLTDLNLSNNQITGSLPAEIENLANLQGLFLDANQLSGNLPDELGNLPNLVSLGLSGNQLIGVLPDTITGLTNLATLDIGYNGLYSSGATATFVTTLDPDWQDTQSIAPDDLNISSNTSGSVTLGWTAIPYIDAPGYYEISYGVEGSGEYRIMDVTDNKYATSSLIEGVQRGISYEYRIRTHSPAHENNANEFSSEYYTITFTIPIPALTAPENLTSLDVSRSRAGLIWDDSMPDETDYFMLERSLDGSNWTQIVQIISGFTSYQDETLTCGTIYYYRVRAYRSEDQSYSPYSNTESILTDDCPPVVEHTVGLYRNGNWQFRDSNSTGSADVQFTFGPQESGWYPLVGDWDNTGDDGIAVYKDGMVIMRMVSDGGAADTRFHFGPQEGGWTPIVGDWNGDGIDSLGIYKEGVFMLSDYNTDRSPQYRFVYGPRESGYMPISGDWNGNGSDSVGLYRDGNFYLTNRLRDGVLSSGFTFGPVSEWYPLIGDWNEDGVSTIGVFREGVWRLRNSNSRGVSDIGFNFGLPSDSGWIPLSSYRGGVGALQVLALSVDASVTLTPEITLTETETVVPATPEPEITESVEVTESVEPEVTIEPEVTEVIDEETTETPLPTVVPTETPLLTATDTPEPLPTETSLPTATDTPEPPTETPLPTATVEVEATDEQIE